MRGGKHYISQGTSRTSTTTRDELGASPQEEDKSRKGEGVEDLSAEGHSGENTSRRQGLVERLGSLTHHVDGQLRPSARLLYENG